MWFPLETLIYSAFIIPKLSLKISCGEEKYVSTCNKKCKAVRVNTPVTMSSFYLSISHIFSVKNSALWSLRKRQSVSLKIFVACSKAAAKETLKRTLWHQVLTFEQREKYCQKIPCRVSDRGYKEAAGRGWFRARQTKGRRAFARGIDEKHTPVARLTIIHRERRLWEENLPPSFVCLDGDVISCEERWFFRNETIDLYLQAALSCSK